MCTFMNFFAPFHFLHIKVAIAQKILFWKFLVEMSRKVAAPTHI